MPKVKSKHTLQKVDPLATPKGFEIPRCKVCSSQARLSCPNCRTNYCTRDHFKMDQLHDFLCDHMRELQNLKTWVPMGEERERFEKLRNLKQISIARRTEEMARASFTDGEPSQALLSAQLSLKLHQAVLGRAHEDSILVHLLVASCHMALKQLAKSINNLAQVDHHLVSRSNTSGLVLGECAKTYGQLALHQNKVDDAIYHFSDEIYHMGQYFGTEHHRTGVSLWRLGQSFLRLGKFKITNSMYRQSVSSWQRFLTERLQAGEAEEEEAGRAVVSINTEKDSSLLDQRAKTDGAEMLQDILLTRTKPPGDDLSDPMDVLLIHYVFAMYQFAVENYVKSFGLLQMCLQISMPVISEVPGPLKDAMLTLYKRSRRKMPMDAMLQHRDSAGQIGAMLKRPSIWGVSPDL